MLFGRSTVWAQALCCCRTTSLFFFSFCIPGKTPHAVQWMEPDEGARRMDPSRSWSAAVMHRCPWHVHRQHVESPMPQAQQFRRNPDAQNAAAREKVSRLERASAAMGDPSGKEVDALRVRDVKSSSSAYADASQSSTRTSHRRRFRWRRRSNVWCGSRYSSQRRLLSFAKTTSVESLQQCHQIRQKQSSGGRLPLSPAPAPRQAGNTRAVCQGIVYHSTASLAAHKRLTGKHVLDFLCARH